MLQDSKLFTGSAACHKIGAPGKGIRRPPPEFEYTVFIQNTSRGSRCLMKGTTLFYKKIQRYDSVHCSLYYGTYMHFNYN